MSQHPRYRIANVSRHLERALASSQNLFSRAKVNLRFVQSSATMLVSLLAIQGDGYAQTTLFEDQFNGTGFGSQWAVANYSFKKTQFGYTPTVSTDAYGTKYARLRISNTGGVCGSAGNSYGCAKGTAIYTKNSDGSRQTFALNPGQEVTFETRFRCNNIPRGVVDAFFPYFDKDNGNIKDEIDFEIMGNYGSTTGPSNYMLLGAHNDSANITQRGYYTGANLDWRNWNTYKARWYFNQNGQRVVDWIINGVVVRSTTATIPDEPLAVYFNTWAPDITEFDIAYDAGFFTGSQASYYFDVDYIKVSSSTSQIVTNTRDSGPGSLRQAILNANSTPGSTIRFNIPLSDSGYSGGVFTIKPLTVLPEITANETTVAGNTQTAFTGNTNTAGPEVVLNGSLMDPNFSSGAFVISGNSCSIEGLVINGCDQAIYPGNNTLIQYNYIGTNAAGTAAVANGYGINSWGFDPKPNGMKILNNVISGNARGLNLWGGVANMVVQGNLIGTDATGLNPLGNIDGILLDGNPNVNSNNVIGGTGFGQRNIIAYNQNDGIYIWGGAGLSIRGNSIHHNGFLGIDNRNGNAMEGPQGTVTLNDLGDGDIGPNGVQNFPVISSASYSSATNSTVIICTLNSTASSTFKVDFYRNSVADPSGYGEGETYVGIATVTTNSSGNASFSFSTPGSFSGQYVTATATNSTTGDTSEFSQAKLVP